MRRILLCLLALALTLTGLVAGLSSVQAATTPLPRPLPLASIEPLAAYVPQTSCDPHTKPGVQSLADLLTKSYPDTTFGTVRNCNTVSTSEHYEGRALDWMASVRVPAHKAEAQAVLSWLFATDAAGNKYANLRRLGVMYVVWNNQIWGTWNQRWDPYNNCANTPAASLDDYCHRSHIHFSLSWEGAQKRTSFWTAKPAATDYGPCRAADLNWSPRYIGSRATPCPPHTHLVASATASAFAKKLVAYSGARTNTGESGPAVSVVQQAVGAPIDGQYGPGTRAKVLAWQLAHHVPVCSGLMNQDTWRSLLAAYPH